MTASALAQAGSCLLKIASVMVDEERIIKIVGEEHLIDVRHFKGQDLIGNNSPKAGVNYFDVKVEMGTSVPLSATARRELAMSLAQFGILDPTKKADKEKILELLELQRDPATATPGQLDKGNARYENAQLADGQIVDPKDFDDHDLHIATHREFQKSAEYRRILESSNGVNGPIHKLFEGHIEAHMDKLEQIMQSTAGMGPADLMPPPGMGTPPMPPTPPMGGPGGPPTGGGIPPEMLMQNMQPPQPPPI